MKLALRPQPLVFSFRGAGPLCAAAAALYDCLPHAASRLSLYGGRYYLAVGASLGERPLARRAAGPFGRELGPCPVLYAFFEEHGRCLSRDAVAQLGGALRRNKPGSSQG